jgi:hypothetical protein
MTRPTHVCIVASPRPRTGKTLLARALTEFYRMDGGEVVAFDLDAMDSTLEQFLPDCTVHADIGETQSQVALFDQLIVADQTPKVVDVSAHAYEAFFNVLAEIDFAGEAHRQAIEPVILFAASSDPLSVKSYARLRSRFRGIPIAPIYNDGVVRGHNLRDEFPVSSAVALPLHVPALSPTARTIVETKPFSFNEFRRRPPAYAPELVTAEIQSFLKRLHLQFRELGLRLLLSSLRGSLRESLSGDAFSPFRPSA